MKTLKEILSAAATEDELINLFAKTVGIEVGEQNIIDLCTPQILFEFSVRLSLKNPKGRAFCIAKTLYYVRRLKYSDDCRPEQGDSNFGRGLALQSPRRNLSADGRRG